MLSDLFTLAWLLLTLFCALAISNRDARIRGLERTVDHLILALADTRDERDEALRIAHSKSAQIDGHIRDNSILMVEVHQTCMLKSRIVHPRWWRRRSKSNPMAAWVVRRVQP